MLKKFKTLFTGVELQDIKDEISKSLIDIEDTDFNELTDETAWKSVGTGAKIPYIISSKEDKLKNIIVVLNDTIEQLKAIRNAEGFSLFITDTCDLVKEKVRELQLYYKERTHSDVGHRFKEEAYTNAKGKTMIFDLECATKEQQVSTRSSIQNKILKILANIESILQEEEERKLKGKIEMPERMTYLTLRRI